MKYIDIKEERELLFGELQDGFSSNIEHSNMNQAINGLMNEELTVTVALMGCANIRCCNCRFDGKDECEVIVNDENVSIVIDMLVKKLNRN